MLSRLVMLLVIGTSLSCAPQRALPAEARARSLQLHLADYCDGTSSHQLKFQRYPNEAPLCAETKYGLDERDFSSASFGKDGIGAPVLDLCFRPSGRTKFQRFVSPNVGRWIVFLHHGKLLMAAKVMSAEVPDCVRVEGFVDPSHAAALQAAINGR